MTFPSPEADPADVAEQVTEARPEEPVEPPALPLEADDLDVAEQAAEVPHDEDEHR